MSKDLVYQIVSESLIKGLEAAITSGDSAPWQKSWSVNGTACKSYAGKTYRGVNVWILLASGRQGPWITWNQVAKVGGRVKADQAKKYQNICFWKFLDKTDTQADGTIKKGKIPLLRYFRVYSLEQTENVPEPAWLVKDKAKQANPPDPIIEAEKIAKEYKDGPTVEQGFDHGCYIPAQDKVEIPAIAQYKEAGEYYSVLFHELAHSTGHKSRLARFTDENRPAPFGSEDYSKEELVAEMSAAMLLAVAGVNSNKVRENNVAYLKHWIGRLKDDPRLAVCASAQAQKASDKILNVTWDKEVKEENAE